MRLKAIYKDKSSTNKIGILFLIVLLSVFFVSLIALGTTNVFFNDLSNSLTVNYLENSSYINYLKLMQLFSAVGLFILPILIYSYLTGFDLNFRNVRRQNILLVFAIMLLIPPFISLLLEWNMQIQVPNFFRYFDRDTEELVKAFLKMDNIWDLLYTLLVVAVIPALGEELFFRGYLQKKIGVFLKNSHLSIIITSFLFSAIHLHFHGLIPRFVLGMLLGYLFLWSRSLWVPILAHFINNALAIIFAYPLFKLESGSYSLFSEEKVDPKIALISLISVLLLLFLFHKNAKKEVLKSPFYNE